MNRPGKPASAGLNFVAWRFIARQRQREGQSFHGLSCSNWYYEGDLRDYLPLLALGELVHVGKGTVFGNGKYGVRPGT